MDTGSKFVLSVPGMLKLSSIVLILIGSVLSICSEGCIKSQAWATTEASIYFLSAATTSTFYLTITFNVIKNSIPIWILTLLIFSIGDFIVLIVLTIITLVECNGSQSTQIVSQVIIMIGAVLLVVSVIFMYVKWNTNRDRIESEVPQLPTERVVPDARKSIFI